MKNPERDRWQELRARAAIPQELERLQDLVIEIARFLQHKEDRLEEMQSRRS